MVSICTLISSGIVLVFSDHQFSSSWFVRPSVILGLLVPLHSLCSTYVHQQAATTSWWLKLIGGASKADLHREWEIGQNLWQAVSALTSKRFSSSITFSTTALTLSVAISPLLQRASKVESRQKTEEVLANTSLPVNLPFGWTTTPNQALANYAGMISPQLLAIIQDHATKTPISANVTGCLGECFGALQAFGLNGSCHETSKTDHDWAADYFLHDVQDPVTLFNVTFPIIKLVGEHQELLDPERVPQFRFRVSYWTSDTAATRGPSNSSASSGTYQYCPGFITTKDCEYFVDLVKYPVWMTANSIQLNSNETYFGPPHHETVHLEKLFDYPNQLSGLQIAAKNLFSSSVQISNPQTAYQDAFHWAKWDLDVVGLLAFQHVHFNFSDSGSCFQTYTDPTPTISGALGDILLRSAIDAARFQMESFGFTKLYQQRFSASDVRTDLVFVTDYMYFTLAASLVLIQITLNSIPLRDWRKLGRSVSLSPVETAAAMQEFNVSTHANSNTS
jgi:hypothetical protein